MGGQTALQSPGWGRRVGKATTASSPRVCTEVPTTRRVGVSESGQEGNRASGGSEEACGPVLFGDEARPWYWLMGSGVWPHPEGRGTAGRRPGRQGSAECRQDEDTQVHHPLGPLQSRATEPGTDWSVEASCRVRPSCCS